MTTCSDTRFLATGANYRTIGHLFGVSKSTACAVVKEVCWSIVDVLLPDYIHIRTGAVLREVVDEFKNIHGFPNSRHNVWLMCVFHMVVDGA